MKDEHQILSETLNAYLDGELDAKTTARLEKKLGVDARLQGHLRELEQVRALARTAFTTESQPAPPASQPLSRRQLIGYGLAAMLLVATGIGAERWLRMATPEDVLLASLPSHAQVIRPAHLEVTAPAGERRAIFHVTSGDPRNVRSTLDHVEQILKRHGSAGKPLHVEIVANAEGLNALRADVSPAAEQIARLQKDYPNISFLACGTSIARVKREQGINVKLLPRTGVTSSALDQILLRLRQGWVYIRL